MEMMNTSPVRLIDLKEVCQLVGKCGEWIRKMELEGKFPKRKRIGGRSVAWRSDEIEKYIDGCEDAKPLQFLPGTKRPPHSALAA